MSQNQGTGTSYAILSEKAGAIGTFSQVEVIRVDMVTGSGARKARMCSPSKDGSSFTGSWISRVRPLGRCGATV